MLTALVVATLLNAAPPGMSGQVAVISAQRTPPARAETPPAEDAPDTVRVCRWETPTGSNRRARVCRNVPRQGVQDQVTREFMRDRQRYTPDPAG